MNWKNRLSQKPKKWVKPTNWHEGAASVGALAAQMSSEKLMSEPAVPYLKTFPKSILGDVGAAHAPTDQAEGQRS